MERRRKEQGILESVSIADSDGRLRKSLSKQFLPLEKIVSGGESRMQDDARTYFVGEGKSKDHDWILQ